MAPAKVEPCWCCAHSQHGADVRVPVHPVFPVRHSARWPLACAHIAPCFRKSGPASGTFLQRGGLEQPIGARVAGNPIEREPAQAPRPARGSRRITHRRATPGRRPGPRRSDLGRPAPMLFSARHKGVLMAPRRSSREHARCSSRTTRSTASWRWICSCRGACQHTPLLTHNSRCVRTPCRTRTRLSG